MTTCIYQKMSDGVHRPLPVDCAVVTIPNAQSKTYLKTIMNIL